MEKKPRFRMSDLTETEKNNFVGFFALLLKVDRRTNPHLYKKIKVKSK